MFKRNVLTIMILALIIAAVIPSVASAQVQHQEDFPGELEFLLSDYSQYLNTGITSQKTSYSSQMNTLIVNRQEFYKEFFEKGLHSELTSLESHFETKQGMTVTLKDDVYYVALAERVTLYGTPFPISPEEYPLIQAAEWAIAQTKYDVVKDELNDYIAAMEEGVEESLKRGVDIVFIIQHDLKIKEIDGKLQIVEDAFTDKAIDNGSGFENVAWNDGQFKREVFDWMSMIDYSMYHTPIETIGKILLADYEAEVKQSAPTNTKSSTFTYYRYNAKWYANNYTSNPSSWQTCGSGVLQQTSMYNPSYQYVWSVTGCNDCTDYVSQAIRYGGFASNSPYWYPSSGNYNWNVVGGLWYYLASDDFYYGTIPTTYMGSATFGDLAFVGSSHVGMVVGVYPHLFSGHTNDRWYYPMAGMGFTKYIHFWSTITKY